jgi:S1-C subfamily serine protease
VFRIEVVGSKKHFEAPWKPSNQFECSGSGFAITHMADGEEKIGILTNAHVVNDAVMIRVKRQGSTKAEKARIIEGSFAVDLDLAMLTVDIADFWSDVLPLCLSPSLPSLFSDIMVVGFPSGGQQVCVTKGVVSRVTTKGFAIDHFASPEMLAVQIDAAINPGNSGGPALGAAGKICYGVAALKSTAKAHDNVGYIIPSLTVVNYLRDLEIHGKFQGVIAPGFHFAEIQNETLREEYGLEAEGSNGVLITSGGISGVSHAAGVLRKEGEPIGSLAFRIGI